MQFKKINFKKEEVWNTLTHGVGAIFSMVALVFLIINASKEGTALEIVCASIFGASMLVLYTASTIYHAVTDKKLKQVFRKLDHLCIYILIAGTYTPVVLLGIKGAWGWTIFGIIWALAALGFIFKFSPLQKSEKLSLILYAAMGWLIVIALKPLISSLSSEALIYLGMGGLLYTVGIYFYANTKIKFNHAIWHLFVLGGTAFHFFGIFYYIFP